MTRSLLDISPVIIGAFVACDLSVLAESAALVLARAAMKII
jgi:hypothetical protein